MTLTSRRPLVEGSRDDQAAYRQREQTGCCLRHDDVEVLLHAVDAAGEETHAQHQQQVGKHTSDERGLHDEDLVLDQGNDGDDQFDGVTGRVRRVRFRVM